jgi:hypothetical protein
MNVYLDESGDLGFSFDKPYRNGGSSRYLTITILLVPKAISHLPKRIVKDIYKKIGKKKNGEIKSTELTKENLILIANKTVHFLTKHPEIKIISITTNKQNVENHIRNDPNKLYNYMIGLILPPKIKNNARITFIPDKRSIKVESGNSLTDYLRIKLLFEYNSGTIIDSTPLESHTSLNLVYTDWLSHIIWKHFEDGETDVFSILRPMVELSHLFF